MKSLIIEIIAILCLAVACKKACTEFPGRIMIECDGLETRSSSPDESALYDVNIYVFGDCDILEEHYYNILSQNRGSLEINLVHGRDYHAYVVANAGYDIGIMEREKLEKMKYWLSRPDDCRRGIVMSGECAFTAREGLTPTVKLRRLMAKVGVRIDRSRLNDDIDFYVSSVRLCNTPKCAGLFSNRSVSSSEDMFSSGFTKSGSEVSQLNDSAGDGLSEETALYMLENLRSEYDGNLCSYIELHVDYLSDECHSEGDGLVYRHRLQYAGSYDILRNSSYHLTIRPDGNGLLCDDSWRVDQSWMVWDVSDPSLQIYPSGCTVDGTFYEHYYRTTPGDSLNFRIKTRPSTMKIWLDDELVQDDLELGKGLWSLDSDGRKLTFKATGCGMAAAEIYAGSPLNDSETIIVEIM